MKKTFFSNTLSFIACIVLTAAIALFTTGCNSGKTDKPADTQDSSSAVSQTDAPSQAQTEVKVLGEGQTTFMFNVIDADGNETAFEIHTDKTTVGEALVEYAKQYEG